MAVEVELQPERSPRRNPQVAEAQVRVDEVEVVMEALGLSSLQVRAVRLLVVPGPERHAGLHGREDVNESRMVSTLGQDLLDPVLLSEVLPTDELNLEPFPSGDLLGVGADLIAKGLCPSGEVEEPDVVGREVGQLLLARDLDYLPADRHAGLDASVNEVKKMLNSFIRKLG